MESSSVPTLKTSERDELFSLQDLCLLYLVGHLDKYTPNTLSLLPAHLRHQLLCHLPVYDLQSLESTSVVCGLDVSTYWQALYDYFRIILYPGCDYIGCHDCFNLKEIIVPNENRGPKESVLRLAASLIRFPTYSDKGYAFCLRKTPHGISHLNVTLFCLPDRFSSDNVSKSRCNIQAIFELTGLCYFDSNLGFLIPSRLTSLIVVNVGPWNILYPDNALSLMKMLVNHFNYRSHHIPVSGFMHAILFGHISSIRMIAEKYLSQAEMICCNSNELRESHFDIWRNILKENFCAQDATLSKLKLKNSDYESFHLGMELLSPYLGCATASLDLPTYKGLKEIVIHSLWDDKTISSAEHPLDKLAVIIDNQDQLKTLHLHGRFLATPQSDAVMMAVARLMEKKSVESVKLCGDGHSQLNITSVSKVVSSYLFTPTSHKQVLKLSVHYVSTGFMGRGKKMIDTHFEECSHIASTVDGQCMKSLSLDLEQLPSLYPIFSKTPIPVTLKTIELAISGSTAEKYSLLPSFMANTVTLKLKDTYMSQPGSFEIDATGCALILNDRINHLCVSSRFHPIPSSYLNSIGEVIAKHAEHFQTLKYIEINNGKVKEYHNRGPEDFTTLCESLISLAQVIPLELRLQNMLEHLRDLNQVWKKKNPSEKFSKIVFVATSYSKFNVNIYKRETSTLLSDIAADSEILVYDMIE